MASLPALALPFNRQHVGFFTKVKSSSHCEHFRKCSQQSSKNSARSLSWLQASELWGSRSTESDTTSGASPAYSSKDFFSSLRSTFTSLSQLTGQDSEKEPWLWLIFSSFQGHMS